MTKNGWGASDPVRHAAAPRTPVSPGLDQRHGETEGGWGKVGFQQEHEASIQFMKHLELELDLRLKKSEWFEVISVTFFDEAEKLGWSPARSFCSTYSFVSREERDSFPWHLSWDGWRRSPAVDVDSMGWKKFAKEIWPDSTYCCFQYRTSALWFHLQTVIYDASLLILAHVSKFCVAV